MANTDSGRVTIVSLASGRALAQLSGNDAETYSLSEPATITLQGAPSQVAAYQKQADDLILHLQNGSVIRYQHFFSAHDGQQSELIFAQDNSLSRALFTEALQSDPQALTALTPTLQSVNAEDSLTASSPITEAGETATAVGVGLLGLLGAGAGVAAANNGGGHQSAKATQAKAEVAAANSAATEVAAAATSEGEPTEATAPAATAATASEGEPTEAAAPDATVATASEGEPTEATAPAATAATVSEGEPAQAAAATSETAPASTLTAVPDAVAENGATATEAAAGTSSTAASDAAIAAACVKPSLTIGNFTGDGIVSAEEKLTAQTLSGVTQNLAEGSALTVALNGKIYATALAANGSWSVEIPAADLQLLPPGDNRVSVSFANGVGGTTTASKTISVEASAAPGDVPPPQPTIDLPFGDGLMNQQEHYEAYTLTGSTGVIGAGQKIALTIDGVSFAGTVDAQGGWSVPLTFERLMDIGYAEGEHAIAVTATDLWGRTGSASTTFTVDTVAPLLSVDTLAGDNLIDATEIDEPLVISGTGEAGSALTVTFGNESWNSVIGEDGRWQFSVPAETLQGLGEGSYQVRASATDEAGNTSSAGRTVQIFAGETLPGLTFNPISTDDAVNYREGIYGVEITGNSTHLPGGTRVELTLDGKTWSGYVYSTGWSVQLSDTDLAEIKDGSYTVTVSATDVNGNSTSASHDLLLITHYNSSNPNVTANQVTLADVTEHDGQTWYTVTGTMAATLPIKMFAVQSDEMSWREGVIGADGKWSVEVNSYDLGNSNTGSSFLRFGVLDGAGNWFEQGITVPVDLVTPVAAESSAETPVPVEDNPTDGDDASPSAGNGSANGSGADVSPSAGESANGGDASPTAGEPASGSGAEAGSVPTSGEVSLLINSFTGDGIVSAEEKLTAQTLSGVAQNLAEGSALTVALNGKSYAATLAGDGSWNVEIPAADLQLLPVGDNRIGVSFANGVGGTTTVSKTISVEASAAPADAPQPQPTIDAPFGDGWMNESEHYEAYTLTGSTGVTGGSQQIALTLDGVSYAGTVDEQGRWSVPLSLDALREAAFSEGDHNIAVTVTDAWGRTGSASTTFTVDTIAPRIAIDPVSVDNLIDASEINEDVVISGTAEAGRTLTVTFGSESWTGIADENGLWQFSVPAETLQSLGEGSFNVVARLSDEAGNSASASRQVQIYASDALPVLTINPISGDDAVNYREGIYGVEIAGTSSHLSSGTLIELTLDGKTWTGYVYNNSWSVQVGDSELAAIEDGRYAVSVSAADANGNSTSASRDLLLISHYNSSNPVITTNELTLADVTYDANGEPIYTLTGTMVTTQPLTEFAVKGEIESYRSGVINEDGSWSVQLNSLDIYTEQGSNTLVFGVLDAAGNWFEQLISVSTDLITPVGTDGGAAETPVPVSEDNPTDGDTTTPDIGDTTPEIGDTATANPTPSIGVPFGDGWLNHQEKIQGETLSGSTGITGSGQQVVVNISGTRYQAAVTDEGKWSLALTSAQLMGNDFSTGKHWINVYATNAEGETGKTSAYFFTDVGLPHVSIDTPWTAGINLSEAQQKGYVFTGTGDAGDALTLTLGALAWHLTVDFDGNWLATLTPEQAQQLTAGDYKLQASISDMAKNVGSSSLALDFYSGDTQPVITINNLSDDNRINLNTITNDYPITGTGEVGGRVSVTIGSLNVGGDIVGQNGEWKVNLSESDALQLASGDAKLTATLQNAAGQTHSASLGVTFYAAEVQPTLTMDTVEINDIVDYSTWQNDVSLYGDSYGLHRGTEITVTLGAKTYIGYVYDDHWMATIPSADIKAAADGYYTLTASVESAGGSASASREVLLLSHIYSSDPTLTFNPLTPEDVVYHGDRAYYVISGTVTEPLPVEHLSFYGGEMLNYYPINVAEDGTFTAEVAVSEYSLFTPGFSISYQDAAGHWYETQGTVTLPDAPVAVAGADQIAVSVLTEDNPVDGDYHVNTTDEKGTVAAATAVGEGAATSTESSSESVSVVSTDANSESAATPAHGESIDGVATAVGTEGDDTFTLSTLNLLSNLNGGAGQDTLVLNGSHEALDFASLGLKVSSVETLDLGGSGSNSITLGQKDLLALTDNASEALTIKGADGSTVTLSTAEGGVWSDIGQRSVGGQQYELYHNAAASHDGTLADVLIQHNLQVQTA